VLVLVQDRCTVCAKQAIGLEIGYEAQQEARFGLFGDNAILDAR
jgi:hypothetical protein